MWGASGQQLLAGVGEKVLALAGTSPTSAMVGAAMAYLGVRLLRRGNAERAG